MKANKHEINGYIYVTSEEKPKENESFIHSSHGITNIYKAKSVITESIITECGQGCWMIYSSKIILTNNPNLPIQQLTEVEVEYLKSVDRFEVEKEQYYQFVGNTKIPFVPNYKIIIPQETEKCTCKIPEPKMKNSENGISAYCGNCSKEYSNQTEKTIQSEDRFIDFEVLDKEQPKESIEEVAENYANYNEQSKKAIIESVKFGYNHAKQTMYSEDEVVDLLKKRESHLNNYDKLHGGFQTTKEWFNKHKKQ